MALQDLQSLVQIQKPIPKVTACGLTNERE
jgi:hypothetical protein